VVLSTLEEERERLVHV